VSVAQQVHSALILSQHLRPVQIQALILQLLGHIYVPLVQRVTPVQLHLSLHVLVVDIQQPLAQVHVVSQQPGILLRMHSQVSNLVL